MNNPHSSGGCRAIKSCHSSVSLCFFILVMVLTVLTFHPLVLGISLVSSLLLYFSLEGRQGLTTLLRLLPFALLTLVLNPLLNAAGETILFVYAGRPFTLEALLYGASMAMMISAIFLWSLCLHTILGDRLLSLCAPLAPAFSLLLVMVLRLLPAFFRKARQILYVRKCIGKGSDGTRREQISSGFTALSALTGWALEGSVVTADSMKARGYGCGKRTSFLVEKLQRRDLLGLLFLLILAAGLAAGFILGYFQADFIPSMHFSLPGSLVTAAFFAAFILLVLFPFILQLFTEINHAQFERK